MYVEYWISCSAFSLSLYMYMYMLVMHLSNTHTFAHRAWQSWILKITLRPLPPSVKVKGCLLILLCFGVFVAIIREILMVDNLS